MDPRCAKCVDLEGVRHKVNYHLIICFQVLSGNIEHVHIKEKAKFAQEFFPDVRIYFWI